MRRAGSRCRFSTAVAVFLATVVGVSVSAVLLVAGPAPPAGAAVAPLTVAIDRDLSLVNEAVTLTIEGQISGSLIGTKLVVRVKGPAELSQIGQANPELPEAAKIVRVLGAVPTSTGGTTGGTGEETTTTTTTTEPAGSSTAAELAAGVLKAKVTIPSGTPARPGGYLLVVEVKAAGEVTASGRLWVGKAAVREVPLDIAFVWPVSLGIHRDTDGVFYDQVLEQALAPTASNPGDLRALLALPGHFPEWDLTLAVEPVLLTQLRDMADGYVRLDSSGKQIGVGEDATAALSARAALDAFKALAPVDSVEVAVSPYAGADLGVLAAEGWRDGLEQIQMGKQELQQTLGLEGPPMGAYSPDLELTTGSLAYYADASIDHVVVDAALVELLTEQVAEGAVAVRARDTENNRVTLVFASTGLSALMTAPWDPGVFFAGLAAELASGAKDAIVATPGVEFVLPPESYLESIGKTLEGAPWVRTQTLTALVRSHSPGTRPVMLKTDAGGTRGYIEESLLAGLRAAHAAVTDLGAIADPTRAPVETAHRLLYIAESRWWSRAQTSPQEASIGLAYAEEAQTLAEDELDKIGFVEVDPPVVTGHEGDVELAALNDADYPVTVELRLSGTGLTFPDGDQSEVELAPGRTAIPVRVAKADGPHRLDAQLMAGDSPLDKWTHSVRFVGVTTILPWAIPAVLVIGGGAYALYRWRPWRRRAAKAA